MPNRKIVIDPLFEGPPGFANGGYTCGVLASHMSADAEITLRKPVPLGTGLRLAPYNGGLALHNGNKDGGTEDSLVAEGAPALLVDHTPRPPVFAEALAAMASFPGLRFHPFPRCVVCGTGRTDAVALRIFPGPLAARELVAAVWYPGSDAIEDGFIKPEFAWAALDCPGGWAAAYFGGLDRPTVLGRMAARLVPPVTAQQAHIVVGWLEGVSGRKLTAGTALYTRDGVLQGFSRQTWITLPDANAGSGRS